MTGTAALPSDTLQDVRRRLDRMVDARLVCQFTEAEHAMYRRLVELEAELLATAS